MKRIQHRLRWHRLAALIALASWVSARGQARHMADVEPQMFRMRLVSASQGVYGEFMQEDVSYRGGFSSTLDRYFFGPLESATVEGSIYHPNLFQYNLATDWAWGWASERTTTSAGKTLEHDDFDSIGSFSGSAVVLANKPYRANLFASSSHSYREYDFFNRAMVDTLRYGFTSGYSEGPVPFTLSLTRYEEDASGLGYETSLRQTTLNLDAKHERETGITAFAYAFNDYERSVETTGGSGFEQTFGLNDRETFGTKNVEWRNSISYSQRELNGEPGDAAPNDAITASSHLQVQHTRNLMSTFDARYLRDEAHAVTTENLGASAGVQHRLYSSLVSGLRVEVDDYSSERAGGNFESTQYLGSWSEAYTKKLGWKSRISIGGSLGYSHTDQDSSTFVPVIGEAHTFTGGPFVDSFFLRLLNVDPGTIQVWSPDRTIRYIRDADYSVILTGDRTVIELLPTSPSGLTAASQVVVDYQASAQGSGSIDGQFTDAQIRLDLNDGMYGIYARFNDVDNEASRGLIVEDSTDIAFGGDFARKWLRAGVEYQIHDATFASYTTLRAYQSFTFHRDEASVLNVTFSEGTTDYDPGGRVEDFYSAILRFHEVFTRELSMDLDAGVTERQGSGVDQETAVVRPSVSYSVGKLFVKLSYDFEYRSSESGEERTKHMVILRAKRTF